MQFLSKAQTLEELRPRLKSARVLPSVRFSVGEFRERPHSVMDEISQTFGEATLIVRSSAQGEDGSSESQAGKFESCANVGLDGLSDAVDRVIASYGDARADDEVFVQPQLQKIVRCGVVMTADADTLAPYYTINYSESESHDAVTSGQGVDLLSYVFYKGSPVPPNEKWMVDLLAACSECEALFDTPHLDIEFACNENGDLYLFQVRPIVVEGKEDLSHLELDDALEKMHSKIQKVFHPHPQVLGKKGMLGTMPDWNPAEIIGIKPRPLALSLYKELVTDSIWAYQRDNYGYRNLRSHPLLISLMGIPLVDVRASFNSFIPKSLDDGIAEKLIDVYLERLAANPEHHDKVEFEIVYSCFDLDLPERLQSLRERFSADEIQTIENSLRDLTQEIITSYLDEDMGRVGQLADQHDRIMQSDLPVIDKIYWLIEHCKRFGTLPFAGAARAGFVAVQFLRSFVSVGILTEDEADAFMRSLNTVSKQLSSDSSDREEFLEKYGHLRPGSYDILSLRYDENFEGYFSQKKPEPVEAHEFIFSDTQLEAINTYPFDASKLIDFMKRAIEGREHAKFLFTKTLSEILNLLALLGERLGISREEMALVDIHEIKACYASLDYRDLADILRENIAANRKLYEYTKAIKLPTLLCDADEIYRFQPFSDEPNYVTLKRVQAPVGSDDDLEGKIVCIRSADPGYDYLFSKNIAGLVTAYGGTNSHMAIRCAELGLPAVIGAGEANFNRWSQASVLEIDALHHTTTVIS